MLRWGPGYTGGEDPLNLLRDVIEAEEIRLDRWTVVFHPEDKPEESALKAPSNSTGKKKKVHQAQLSQQNQHHQIPAITSSDISGHLMSKTKQTNNLNILIRESQTCGLCWKNFLNLCLTTTSVVILLMALKHEEEILLQVPIQCLVVIVSACI